MSYVTRLAGVKRIFSLRFLAVFLLFAIPSELLEAYGYFNIFDMFSLLILAASFYAAYSAVRVDVFYDNWFKRMSGVLARRLLFIAGVGFWPIIRAKFEFGFYSSAALASELLLLAYCFIALPLILLFTDVPAGIVSRDRLHRPDDSPCYALLAKDFWQLQVDTCDYKFKNLQEISVCDFNNELVTELWSSNDMKEIEELLNKMQKHNADSATHAVNTFNYLRDHIELSREHLRYFVFRMERVLEANGCDTSKLVASASGTLERSNSFFRADTARFARASKNATRGAGQAAGRLISQGLVGNGNLGNNALLAGAIVVTGLVINEVNKQKIKRELKEYEGKLRVQASVIIGDITIIRTDCRTYLMPQIEMMKNILKDCYRYFPSPPVTVEDFTADNANNPDGEYDQNACPFANRVAKKYLIAGIGGTPHEEIRREEIKKLQTLYLSAKRYAERQAA